MMPVAKDLLDVVMQNLQRYVAPQVTTEDGRMTLQLVTYVLAFLYVEEHDRPTMHDRRFAALEPLMRELKRRWESEPPWAAFSAGVGDARMAVDQALAEPRSPDATSQALQLAVRAGAPDTEWIRKFASAELAYLEQLADAVNGWAYGAAANAIPDPSQRQLTADLLTGYLRRQQPAYPDIHAVSVVEIGGGFSKKTYKLAVGAGPADWERLVIRQDAIGGPVPSSCLDEVDVLRLAEAHGLPLGNLMWVEPSADLDAPFLFSRQAAGVCSLDAWKHRALDGAPPGEQLAREMARLHTIPLTDLPGFDAASTPQNTLTRYVAGFEQRWQRDRTMFDPLIQLGFDWLKEHIPRNVERLAIVHGDLSERNVMVHEGMITAILDWELWHIGDPMYDLAYVKPFIEQTMAWTRFVQIYESEGGPPVSMINEDYWYIFSKIRDSAMLSSGLRTFVDGRNRNLKTIAPVLGWYRPQLRLAMRRLVPLL